MELRVLRYFLAVARERSISGAAQRLHISQPTLSRQIMELEATLGTTLFHRGNRRITLTPQGMLLQKRAEQIVALVHKTEEELTAPEDTVSGTIYLAAGETRVFQRPAQTLRRLVRQYPDIHIYLSSGNAEYVMDALDKGTADFGLLIEPYDVAKYDSIRLPESDAWGVLMRKDSPLAARDAIRPEDLRDVPLICSRQALEGGQLSSRLRADSEQLNIVASYNLLFNASVLVEAGVGYALCLGNIINTTGDSALCFRPLEPPLTSHVGLVWKKSQVFSKAAGLFLEKIRSESLA